ncbi:MAG: hypothetical protein U5L11_14070 [Arhodomonas sp.]|nr:hypothetical protein [Arhodomonas sp.]
MPRGRERPVRPRLAGTNPGPAARPAGCPFHTPLPRCHGRLPQGGATAAHAPSRPRCALSPRGRGLAAAMTRGGGVTAGGRRSSRGPCPRGAPRPCRWPPQGQWCA